ncbi:solute carrier family 35 member G1 isoform X2 [Lemur catta]|uniref:solute carrier family 35 member G1 isoform X2 n=1 Tax=Lemur catta TaxID=9447 RepID=UPI001E26A6D4|nr:solute carrier family 35 member G1 isoform X2 [Lemur catta]
MRPEDSAGAAEPGELASPLTDEAPPGASEAPAAAETAGTPGRGRCWLCPSPPCGSRAEPGVSMSGLDDTLMKSGPGTDQRVAPSQELTQKLGLLAQKVNEFSSFSEESLVLPP